MTDTKRAFSLLPTVITLAWPTMLENIMATAVQYIDTAMVGTLGTRATAAVGSTMTINWLLGGSLYAFGVGFLAYISQARGAGDQDRIRSTATQAVMMVIVVGDTHGSDYFSKSTGSRLDEDRSRSCWAVRPDGSFLYC